MESQSYEVLDKVMGVCGTLLYAVIGLLLLFVGYKVIDWCTPGDLDQELLGTAEGRQGQPNIALAIVVGAMVLGLSLIVAASIH